MNIFLSFTNFHTTTFTFFERKMSDDHSVTQLLMGSPTADENARHYHLRPREQTGHYTESEEILLEGNQNAVFSPLGLDPAYQGSDMDYLATGGSSAVPPSSGLPVAQCDRNSESRDPDYQPPNIPVRRGPGASTSPSSSDGESAGDSDEENAEVSDTAEGSTARPRFNRKQIKNTHEPTTNMSADDMLYYYEKGMLRLRNLDQLLLFLNTVPSNQRTFESTGNHGYWSLFNRNSHVSLYNLLNSHFGILFNANVFTVFNTKRNFTKDDILDALYTEACESRWKNHREYFELVVNNCFTGLQDFKQIQRSVAFNGVPDHVRTAFERTPSVKKRKRQLSKSQRRDSSGHGKSGRSFGKQCRARRQLGDGGHASRHDMPEQTSSSKKRKERHLPDNGGDSSRRDGSDARPAAGASTGEGVVVRHSSGDGNGVDALEVSDQTMRARSPPYPPPGWDNNFTAEAILSSERQTNTSHESDPPPPPPPSRSGDYREGAVDKDNTEDNSDWLDTTGWSPENREPTGAPSVPGPLQSHEGADWQVQTHHQHQNQSVSGEPVDSGSSELVDEYLRSTLSGYIEDMERNQRRHKDFFNEAIRQYQRCNATFNLNLQRKVREMDTCLVEWHKRKESLDNDLKEEGQKLAEAIVHRQNIEEEMATFRAERARFSTEQSRIRAEQDSRNRMIDALTDELNLSAALMRDSQRKYAADVAALSSARAALETDRARIARESESLARNRDELDIAKEAFRNSCLMKELSFAEEKKRQMILLDETVKKMDETIRKKKEAWSAEQNETRLEMTRSLDKLKNDCEVQQRELRESTAIEIREQKAAWAAEKAEQERAIQAMRESTKTTLESAQAAEARAREQEASTKAAEEERKKNETEAREKLKKTIQLAETLDERIKNKEQLLEAEMAEKTNVLNQQIELNRVVHAQLADREMQLLSRENHAMNCQVAMNGYFSNLQSQIFQSLKTHADNLKIPLQSPEDVRNLIGDISMPLPVSSVFENNPLTSLMLASSIAVTAGKRDLPGLYLPTAAAGGGGGTPAAGGGGMPTADGGGAPPAAAGGGPGGGDGDCGGGH
jgi:hypothetical protein